MKFTEWLKTAKERGELWEGSRSYIKSTRHHEKPVTKRPNNDKKPTVKFPITISDDRVIEEFDENGELIHLQIDQETYYHKRQDGTIYRIWEDFS